MNADRIVLPIPPGKHWSDELPILVPQGQGVKALPSEGRRAKEKKSPVPAMPRLRQFGGPNDDPEPVAAAPIEKSKPEKKPKAKADPKLVVMVREVKDRWLEQNNSGAFVIEPVLPRAREVHDRE